MEKGSEIRDCNFERDTEIGDFTKRKSGNDIFFGESGSKMYKENQERVAVHFLQPLALSPTYHAVMGSDYGATKSQKYAKVPKGLFTLR